MAATHGGLIPDCVLHEPTVTSGAANYSAPATEPEPLWAALAPKSDTRPGKLQTITAAYRPALQAKSFNWVVAVVGGIRHGRA